MAETVTGRDRLLAAEGLAALVVLAALVLAAVFYPLDGVGHRGAGEVVRAPWLFLGLQELLRRLPPWLAGLVLPGAALALFLLLPWLAGGRRGEAVPRARRFWAPAEFLAWALLLAWLGLTVWGARAG